MIKVIEYTSHTDITTPILLLPQNTLAILDKLDLDNEELSEEAVARLFGFEDAFLNGELSSW